VIRTNKLTCVSLAFALALLVAIVVVAGTSDGSSVAKQQPPREPDATRQAYALLGRIPQHGAVLGYPTAPVTLQFFGDLQCLDSRWVMLGALPFVIRRWVRAGKLRIRFRSKETDTRNAGGWYEFREQQTAAMAAGKQGKLWNFIDVFYREQGPEFTGYVDDAFLNQVAVDAGLDLQRWSRDRVPLREAGLELIEADEALAKAKGLRSTPSFLIGPTGGPSRPLLHFSLDEPRVFDEAIEATL
jgi:protein-disulfide isomerase